MAMRGAPPQFAGVGVPHDLVVVVVAVQAQRLPERASSLSVVACGGSAGRRRGGSRSGWRGGVGRRSDAAGQVCW